MDFAGAKLSGGKRGTGIVQNLKVHYYDALSVN